MPALGPTLETARLILRPPVQEDLDGFAAMMADEESARFIGGVMTRSATWRGMAAIVGMWSLRGFGMFSTIEKATGQWIGRLGPWMPEGWPGAEVGWALARPHWGKGYATEGATAAIDWVFDSLGWSEVIHCIDPPNLNSAKVAARLGSERRGSAHLPAPFDGVMVDVYGQSRERWRARR